MPQYLIVELLTQKKQQFRLNNLQLNHYYIEPVTTEFKQEIGKKNTTNISNLLNGTKPQTNFHRIQFPLDPYFAITSYKIQSKTKTHLIIDLCSPNRAIYNNDAYVKLGRVKTLEGLKILRDFNYSKI